MFKVCLFCKVASCTKARALSGDAMRENFASLTDRTHSDRLSEAVHMACSSYSWHQENKVNLLKHGIIVRTLIVLAKISALLMSSCGMDRKCHRLRWPANMPDSIGSCHRSCTSLNGTPLWTVCHSCSDVLLLTVFMQNEGVSCKEGEVDNGSDPDNIM